MTDANRYTVIFEADAVDGGWVVSLEGHGVQGVRSDGDTLDDARRRIREALELAIGEAQAQAATFDEQFVGTNRG